MSLQVEDIDKNQTGPEHTDFTADTLRRHYGDVTPYGTLSKNKSDDIDPGNTETQVPFSSLSSNDDDTVRRKTSPTIRPSWSGTVKSTGSHMTTLRRSKGGFYTLSEEAGASLQNLGYIDFLPKKTGRSIHASRNYHSFGTCVAEANKFLKDNPNVQIKNCESLYQRLDHNHRINSNSTTSHDRSYVIGIRLWYVIADGENDVFVPPESTNGSEVTATTQLTSSSACDDSEANFHEAQQKLCYLNVLPERKDKADTLGRQKHNERPLQDFKNFRSTVEKLNSILKEREIHGKIVSVESIPINFSHAFRDGEDLNPDHGYWCLDYHGRWNLIMLRIFYIETKDVLSDVDIDFRDFVPVTVEASRSYSRHHSLCQEASRWLSQEETATLIGSQTIEVPIHFERGGRRKKIDTGCSAVETSKISAQMHTLKILRLWITRTRAQETNTLSPIHQTSHDELRISPLNRTVRSGIVVRTFLPCQVTTAGCCGVRKPIFATTEDTVQRINEWISLTGADVLCIQTDNIEKWSGKQCEIGTSLAERTYNKEDFSNSVVANFLEYRVTAFRVFIRADSRGVFQEPEAHELLERPKPVEPCCCFVGCALM